MGIYAILRIKALHPQAAVYFPVQDIVCIVDVDVENNLRVSAENSFTRPPLVSCPK